MTFDTSQRAYRALRDIVAERTEGIVFWTGSGLSAEVGLPTWVEFRSELVEALNDKINQLEAWEQESLRELAQLIQLTDNNWQAFDMLRDSLGGTTWRAQVREILIQSASVSIPMSYQQMWKLKPHGLLTLNLDRLATRAYAEVHGSHNLTEFVGNQIHSHTHVLRNPYPFLCQLHGDLDDASSWILTYSDLKQQQNSASYRNFIRSCLSTKTVVFIGISADDVAVGGFVENLSSLGIDFGPHYWVTPRRDLETDRWAEDQGIRLIRYDAPDGDHSEVSVMLNDLIDFVSADDPAGATPISPVGLSPSNRTLPHETDLLNQDAESIRKILNEEASRILQHLSQDAVDEYNRFSRTYDQAVYRAWYTSTELGNNRLLDHVLHEEVASGAFGRVYRATDVDGNDVAVKVLHEEIRRNTDLIQAFRRGVHSMRILADHSVQGMVPYRNAFEIPAFVVMDWIDGPNLADAVASTQIDDWESILRIGSDMADIIRRGHVLPARVLHRDIRPSNVMLREFYSDPESWDVVVLDFDLSWHRGALARSVIHGSAMLGYLAPEQIQDIAGVSTRHASVDSFGLGMVLFFMMSERDPVPDEHRHTNWNNTLRQAALRHPCSQWYSTPRRFARLVEFATQDKQSERWDMTQIQAELQRLHSAVLNPSSIRSVELVAEEVAARCDFSKDYEWDGNILAAVKENPSGVRIELVGDESAGRVLANLSWGRPGVQGRAHLGRWIEPAMKTVRDMLRSSGWRIEESRSEYAHIAISASLSNRVVLDDMDGTVDSLNRALERLRFS